MSKKQFDELCRYNAAIIVLESILGYIGPGGVSYQEAEEYIKCLN